MTNQEKIDERHLRRQAIVYLRQSTLRQVRVNRESTDRQYALKDRAIALGWSTGKISVFDEDLGCSGGFEQQRAGFQRLAEQVAHGQVGGIFALEVPRLARSSADWYRLLDLCGLADVIIADEQAVYAPRDYNDRLLLGLKGQMSEAERYWLRLRLEGAKTNKARRGELHFRSPPGYEWDVATQRFCFTDDEEIKRVVRLVFERFRVDGSVFGVFRYFQRHGLRLPARDNDGTVRWVNPRYRLLWDQLKHPIYAGVYAYGRRESRVALVNGEVRCRSRSNELDECKVVIMNQHSAYISWEEFMKNQRTLRENRTNIESPERKGAAREGSALLQGMVLCGICGHRMVVHYTARRQGGRPSYKCRPNNQGDACWCVPSSAIDEAVVAQFLDVVQPEKIKLSLAVSQEVERQGDAVSQQWRLRLERAQYEARLAERRYKAVDPENRIVARTLEREWEARLQETETLDAEYSRVKKREKLELTAHDRAQIVALSEDLPALWRRKTTTSAQRKHLLRTLIREVTLKPMNEPERQTRVQILWQTGTTSEFGVIRKDRLTAQATPEEAVDVINSCTANGTTDEQIAAVLNQRGLRTGVNRVWTAAAVRTVRLNHGFTRPGRRSRRAPERRKDGLYSVHGIARRFDVLPVRVRGWARSGLIREVARSSNGTRWFKIGRSDFALLKQKIAAANRGNSKHSRR